MDKHDKEKTSETLRNLKRSSGATWAEIGDVLGFPATTLSAVASINGASLAYPELIKVVLGIDGVLDIERKEPEERKFSGKAAFLVADNKIRIIQIPQYKRCAVCASFFVPNVHNAKYCGGRCRLKARRERERKMDR